MTGPTEITITIKGDDSTFKQKFLVYEEITLNENDEVLKQCIDEAREGYKGIVDTLIVRASLTM